MTVRKGKCLSFILQVYSLLEKATQNRAVAATQCNERSSRSHSVFRLKLTGENHLTGEKCQGTESFEPTWTCEPLPKFCFPCLRCKNFFALRSRVVFTLKFGTTLRRPSGENLAPAFDPTKVNASVRTGQMESSVDASFLLASPFGQACRLKLWPTFSYRNS